MKLLPSPLLMDQWSEATEKLVEGLPGPILVVGAAGFIGARLFYSLLSRRDDVYGTSQYPPKAWRFAQAPHSNVVPLDIRGPDQVKEVFARIAPRTVFNLAAYGSYSWEKDAETIHATNYMGTHYLLSQSIESGVSAFVNAGTSSEYGLNCSAPDEEAKLKPNSEYAVSKVGAATQIQFYGKILGFPCLNLRLYSVYGPWEDPRRLIYKAVGMALEGQLPPFVDRHISRDFVFIDDCTMAFVMAASAASRNQLAGQSINIASGEKVTMEEVAETLKKVFNIATFPEFAKMPNRDWDLREWFGNGERAQCLLGWKPLVTFEKGLRLTAEWITHFERLR